MAKYPVTEAQWQDIIGISSSGCEDCPIEFVSWHQTQRFLQKLNKLTDRKFRLPSEAEWEFAAKGGNKSQGYKYSGGNDIDEVAWYNGNSKNKRHPVGLKKANELGLYDMCGNVWEWCQDYWHKNYKYAPKDGSAWIERAHTNLRVLRGGQNSTVTSRGSHSDDNSSRIHYGFRLVESSL